MAMKQDEIIRKALSDTPPVPGELHGRLVHAYANRKPSHRRLYIAVTALAAATALCGAGVYVGTEGHFEDVMNWFGAVTGTTYEDATEELKITAVPTEDGIAVSVALLTPDKAPYPYIEQLAISDYTLKNKKKTIAKGTVPAAALTDTGTEFLIPLEAPLVSGTYTLTITCFEGSAKGDQPLPIKGKWTADITVS